MKSFMEFMFMTLHGGFCVKSDTCNGCLASCLSLHANAAIAQFHCHKQFVGRQKMGEANRNIRLHGHGYV